MLDLSIVMWRFTRGYMGYISSMWIFIHGRTRTPPAASTSPTAAPSTRRPEAGAGRLALESEAFPWADAVDGQLLLKWHISPWKIMENHGNGGFHQWENPKIDGLEWQNPMKSDDLGVPLFQETSICMATDGISWILIAERNSKIPLIFKLIHDFIIKLMKLENV